MDIRTTEGCCACGYSFVVGVHYLVFALRTNGGFGTSTCTPTQPLRTASALIEQLKAAAATGSPAQIFGFVGAAPKDRRKESVYQTKPLDSIPIRAVGTQRTFETKTSPQGAYAFHNLPPDKYRVQAVLPSGLTTADSEPVELGPNTRGCQANIRVLDDGRISGSVVNGKGEPLRAYVAVIPEDEEPAAGAIASHTTSEDGRFRLPLLPAGRYFLYSIPEIDGRINHRGQRIYYPGTSIPAEAKVIELGLGEHVDFIRFVVLD
ncbi:MAG: collagen binding domain-containing protein [Bryobacteraceae bacterium]